MSQKPAPPPESNLPLHMLAAELVKEHIRNHALEPGQPLPHEGELAERFGMSRTAVREALKYLSAQGFVEVKHGSGVYVAAPFTFPTLDQIQFRVNMDDSLYDDLLEMRLLLESGIAPLVLKRVERQDLEAMSRAIWDAKKRFEQGELDLREQDLAFHLSYLMAAKNTIIAEYGHVLRRFFAAEPYGQENRTPDIIRETLDEHLTIYESILREDAGRLRDTVTKHLGRRQRRLQ